jgi:hypothetical protein
VLEQLAEVTAIDQLVASFAGVPTISAFSQGTGSGTGLERLHIGSTLEAIARRRDCRAASASYWEGSPGAAPEPRAIGPGAQSKPPSRAHHAFYLTPRFPGDAKKPAIGGLLGLRQRFCLNAFRALCSLGGGIPFPRCRSILDNWRALT